MPHPVIIPKFQDVAHPLFLEALGAIFAAKQGKGIEALGHEAGGGLARRVNRWLNENPNPFRITLTPKLKRARSFRSSEGQMPFP